MSIIINKNNALAFDDVLKSSLHTRETFYRRFDLLVFNFQRTCYCYCRYGVLHIMHSPHVQKQFLHFPVAYHYVKLVTSILHRDILSISIRTFIL